MGAHQSSEGNLDTGSVNIKTCYYDLLELSRDATDEEIKKAYRRKALELHPDRNLNDVDNATRRFAEVQAAYEVLSDPQEKAWYDSHRHAILRGVDPEDSGFLRPEFDNVRLTSTEEIFSLIRRFDSSVPFTDEPAGFYGISRSTFEHLADEEIAAGEYDTIDGSGFPTFGTSGDTYDPVVKSFYSAWSAFSTRKTFSWKDKYRVSDAPDRRVRRLMEKENKKLRDDAIRDFNDAVRFLVAFVRKRDPRYAPNTQTAVQRQALLRNAAAAQAARSRAANQEKLADAFVPVWARSGQDNTVEDHFSTSEDDSEVEHIECVVCNKIFKSEKQYEAHARSKKHIKAVQQLRRHMRNEDLTLDIPGPRDNQLLGDLEEPVLELAASDIDGKGADNVRAADGDTKSPNLIQSIQTDTESSGVVSDYDEYAPRIVVEGRLSPSSYSNHPAMATGVHRIKAEHESLGQMEDLSLGGTSKPRKPGKARLKREKKAARQAMSQTHMHTCVTCQSTFDSRTKLFDHIRVELHAQPIQGEGNNSKRTR